MNEIQIENALNKFKQLLIEQDARNQKIKSTKDFKDFKSLDKIVIGVCGGDGIGPIITKEAANVLKFILKDDVDENLKKARLALVEATCYVIKSALYLLGIDTVESM